jgi:Tfp pilus assembly protein PilF
MKAQPVKTSALLHRQAVGHFRDGRMDEGIALLKKALELDPGSGEMHSHLAIALVQTGDSQAAARHFEKAARLAPGNPDVQTDCGAFILESNKPQEAERLFRKALKLKPNHPGALLNLGRSLARQGRSGEAEQTFLAALRLNPRWVDALYNLGILTLQMNFPEEGRRYLEKAVALDPKHEQAWVALIRSYERTIEPEGEEKTLAQAEKHLPQSLEFAIIRMSLLIRQGKTGDAATILGEVSQKLKDPASVNPVALFDVAKAYDETGDPARAMQWFTFSSAAQKKTYAARELDRNGFPSRISGYRKSLSFYKDWREAPPPAKDAPCPVFLVGFPRSGTTLLDQIFSGHSAIEVAEEKPAVRAAEMAIAESGGKPEWELLDKLDDAGIEAARRAYFDVMRKSGCALSPNGIFIDKLPLNLTLTPVIRRLFPDARFILALRHPCDCVLSNFMQRFIPNEAMIHTLDLADAAKFYDLCFSAWADAVETMGLNFHPIKYEDVVGDMKGEIIKALGFLGLEWQDSAAAFDETAKKRNISTPSRSQVTQKLYAKASGRWRKYRDYMGDAPEMLRPWAEKFGYDI